jgi:hypothetical protein
MFRMALAIASVGVLSGCSAAPNTTSTTVDIAKVGGVKSSFGPEFSVTQISERAIDPKLLSARKLPEGLTFDPAACAKVAGGPEMPPDLQGNMAAVSAEGNGNRLIAMAVQTSEPVPFNDPGRNCKRVAFQGGRLRGLIEVVDAPKIDGTRTLGVHRVLQTTVNGKTRSGELYNYSAHFGDYQVIVTANPLLKPGMPVAPVDTNRARDLLVKSVAAIRG